MGNQINPMAHLAQDMASAAVLGQTAGLTLLLAEMQALSRLLPVAGPLDPGALRQHDAEVEAEFDNMPV
jgi:hypothetical protein